MPTNPLPESTLAELERLAKKARAAQMAHSNDPSDLNGWRMRQVIAVLGQEYDAIDALVANVRASDKALYAAYDAMCEGRNSKAFDILEAAVGERSDKSRGGANMKLSKDTQALLERLPADGSWMKYWDWRDVREKGFSNRAHALCRRGLIDQKWDNDEGWMYRRAARAAKERT